MRWLTVIDHTEVFVEMAAAKSLGEAGRWLFIALIQILRYHKKDFNPPISTIF